MMLRKIIKIDEDKCTGCGLCATACHEGAIDIIGGKARLTREHFCDGLGDCLPACPEGAISFEEREAPAYDEAAVKENMRMNAVAAGKPQTGCPGSGMMELQPATGSRAAPEMVEKSRSRLRQWPVQIKLLPVKAPFYDGAKLLVAADCTAYAYGNIHEDFMKDKVTLIGCPKLDSVDYAEKLAGIIKLNDVRSVTVLRMDVPCCGGMDNAVKRALQQSGKMILWQVLTVTRDGRILD